MENNRMRWFIWILMFFRFIIFLIIMIIGGVLQLAGNFLINCAKKLMNYTEDFFHEEY